MITRQLGYQNNYVLMGGLNYWAEAIINPEPPPAQARTRNWRNMIFAKVQAWPSAEQQLPPAMTTR